MSIKAQKCLVMFGVNELVTINPIKNPKFTLMYNDSIEVPFQQLQQELSLIHISEPTRPY